MKFFFMIIIAILVLLVVLYIIYYNRFVSLRNRVKNAWGQIDVQLKRRADLIPNLVETVKGYASHESQTLENVIRARNTAITASAPSERIEAENQLSGALRQLFALSESYPELKANTNFEKLQAQLEETEDKISYMRQSFNDTVYLYNTAIQQFPGNIIAGLGKFELADQFEVADLSSREVPKVSFSQVGSAPVNRSIDQQAHKGQASSVESMHSHDDSNTNNFHQ